MRRTLACLLALMAYSAAIPAEVECCAEELVNEDSPCSNLVDGDRSTIWHTPYNGSPPHWVKMTFPEAGRVISCTFVHRPDGVNGTPISVTTIGEGQSAPLWVQGPDDTDLMMEFDPPVQIQHNTHELQFNFGLDFNGNGWTALAEIDCHFEPDQQAGVDPPCFDIGYTPTPVFEFTSNHDPETLDGFGFYVAQGSGEWELVHVINCGYHVDQGDAVWICPTPAVALQRYAELPPCAMYQVGVTAIAKNQWVESTIVTDETTWIWHEWWDCQPQQNGCVPMQRIE